MIKISEQTLFAGRFILERLLGRGGFSEVWLATDNVTGLEVAIKVYAPGQGMDSDGMKDFCKELSQVYNLNHTNLLKPQHVDSWEGMPYLVMTYCPKGSCHRLIGTMNEKQIWKMIHDVSSGLAYLHKLGVIHQDIKPDNILIDNAGNYVITDFGISVKSRSTLRKSMNAASGSGTTAYMGPERFSADPMPLKSSDIWSLGATAYELITGNAPFGEIGGGLQKGGADLPTIKQNISPELRTVLSKMLALETWNRPTAEQLANWSRTPDKIGISGKLPQKSPVPVNPTPPRVVPNPGGRKSWIIGIFAVVIALIIGIGVWFLLRDSGPNPSECIKIQLDMSKGCDQYIAELNEDNITYKLNQTVLEIRKLESFEKNGPCTLKRKFSKEKMDNFKGKLHDIKSIVQLTLDTYNSNHTDKSSISYKKEMLKMERINAVFNDLENCPSKSAECIHLSSDEVSGQ